MSVSVVTLPSSPGYVASKEWRPVAPWLIEDVGSSCLLVCLQTPDNVDE